MPRDEEAGVDEAELLRVAAFRTALRRFLRRTESVAAEAGLTPQRYDLLLMIASAGRESGVRVTELCELLHMQQTAVTELVKRAEEAGLIERGASSEDGRVSLLKLTPDAERRLTRAVSALRDDRGELAAAFRELDARFRASTR